MKTLLIALATALSASVAGAQPTPTPADGPVWAFTAAKLPETVSYLRYAIPDADEIGVTLSCPRKSGEITARFDVDQRLADHLQGRTWVDRIGRPPPWPISVTLASATAATTLRGQAQPDEMNGGSSISVDVSDRAPVLAEFARTGQLKLTALSGSVQPPPAPKGLAGRFLRSCR